MKCILCEKRKGKRFCPAKNTYICAQCCGEKRVIEIDCPSDCVYLTSGQAYQLIKKYSAQMQQEDDPARRRRLYETHQKFSALLMEIEAAIIHYAADLRSLRDQHICEAITLLKKTYQTERKGVIYEHTSANPLVQALFRELRSLLEETRTQTGDDFPTLITRDLVDCLEVIETDIRYHLDSESGRENYLTFIKRNHPEMASGPTSQRRLIEL